MGRCLDGTSICLQCMFSREWPFFWAFKDVFIKKKLGWQFVPEEPILCGQRSVARSLAVLLVSLLLCHSSYMCGARIGAIFWQTYKIYVHKLTSFSDIPAKFKCIIDFQKTKFWNCWKHLVKTCRASYVLGDLTLTLQCMFVFWLTQ